jgi:periplasmic protein TonB
MNSQTIVDFNETINLEHVVNKICAFVLAAVMTIALLSTMNFLIKNDSLPEDVKSVTKIPNVSSAVPPTIPTRRDPELPVRPAVRHQPPTPYEPIIPTVKPTLSIPGEPVIIDPPKVPGLTMLAQSLPMVKFAPVYPQVATMKGIEGFVDVVFDVTETGATENIQIVYAEPGKIFNSAVLKAVARWKYKPKLDEAGSPVKMFGLRERIRFNMEK